MDRHTPETIPELAGQRVRFITLCVLFEDGVAIEVARVDSSLVASDEVVASLPAVATTAFTMPRTESGASTRAWMATSASPPIASVSWPSFAD